MRMHTHSLSLSWDSARPHQLLFAMVLLWKCDVDVTLCIRFPSLIRVRSSWDQNSIFDEIRPRYKMGQRQLHILDQFSFKKKTWRFVEGYKLHLPLLFEIMVQIKQKRGTGVKNPSPRSFWWGFAEGYKSHLPLFVVDVQKWQNVYQLGFFSLHAKRLGLCKNEFFCAKTCLCCYFEYCARPYLFLPGVSSVYPADCTGWRPRWDS